MSFLINTDAMEVVDRYSWHRMNHPPSQPVADRYLEFNIQVAESLDKDLAYHGKIAAPFVALEACVGLWFGFMHYGLIGPDQYGRLTKQTPVQVLKRARYADALIRWWQEVGYPHTAQKHQRYVTRRHKLLDGTAPGPGRVRDTYAHHAAVQAHACRAIRVGRGLASTASLDELCAGFRRKCGCVRRYRSHVSGACILCAVPVPWEVVADGLEGSRNPAHGASSQGWQSARGKLGADHADKARRATSGG